jgi:hypothetical protein
MSQAGPARTSEIHAWPSIPLTPVSFGLAFRNPGAGQILSKNLP